METGATVVTGKRDHVSAETSSELGFEPVSNSS